MVLDKNGQNQIKFSGLIITGDLYGNLEWGDVGRCAQWSSWRSRDGPGGSFDNERISEYLRANNLPSDMCESPMAIQVSCEI